MTSTILSIILKAVISIAVVLVTGYVIPWLKEKRLYEYVICINGTLKNGQST